MPLNRSDLKLCNSISTLATNIYWRYELYSRYCRPNISIVNDFGEISTLFRSRSKNIFSKCGIIPWRAIVRALTSRKHPAPVWIRRASGAAVRKIGRALRSSVVFPDFCAPQVMRARDLPHAYALSLSFSLLAFSLPAGNPFEKWPLWITRIEILRGVGELRGRCQILALLPRDAVPPTAYVSKQD